MTKDCRAVLDALGVDPSSTVIVGHSLGGLIACEFAARHHPQGVVALGPVHPSPTLGSAMDTRIELVNRGK